MLWKKSSTLRKEVLWFLCLKKYPMDALPVPDLNDARRARKQMNWKVVGGRRVDDVATLAPDQASIGGLVGRSGPRRDRELPRN